MFSRLLSGVLFLAGFALLFFLCRHVFATPNSTGGAYDLTEDRASKRAVSIENAAVIMLERELEDTAYRDRDEPSAKIASGANANAVLSLDLITDGGAGNQRDDGVTSGTVSGKGTTIAIEVFATGVRTSLFGVQINFEFDESLLGFRAADSGAFDIPVSPRGRRVDLFAIPAATLAPSGFLARAEFETVADVTGREFSIGIVRVAMADDDTVLDTLTTVSAIRFNANASPDFDGDGTVGFSDFLLFAEHFGTQQGDGQYDARIDLNRDGAIGFIDFLIFAEAFGSQAPPTGGGGDGGGGGGGSASVTIPDPNLRAVIADSLGKERNATISRAEMATLTRLDASQKGVRDLTGLEHATNLQWLGLTNNSIADISALSNLTNLASLNLGGNISISDISVLYNLTNLTSLSLWQTRISDISVLSNLTNLTHMSLSLNRRISDISALSNLTNLSFLGLLQNSISDISALSNLTNLTRLRLGGNSISDISSLSNLTKLTRLVLSDNIISDISPLVANAGLAGGDTVFVKSNPLSNTSIKTHIPALQRRGVTVEYDGGGGNTVPRNPALSAWINATGSEAERLLDQATICRAGLEFPRDTFCVNTQQTVLVGHLSSGEGLVIQGRFVSRAGGDIRLSGIVLVRRGNVRVLTQFNP